ncbi:hypothetical protein [Rhodoblastus sp.]|uniref:hypothetical protein n=1 Tax=Rhodoblastus sp. TaxID=1962975 RepID=UPI003F9D7094
MVQTQQIIMDSATIACIAMAEHPNTPVEEARTAALKVFQRLRSQGISLPEILARKAPTTITPDQPLTVLMTEKLQHLAEIKDLKTKVAGLRAKVETLSQNLVVAKNEARELRDASKSVNAKVSNAVASALKASKAEMAEMRAELKSVRAQAADDRAELAAERAKPAPISADDLATLEDAARDQQSRIATLLDKLAKDVAAPGAAPAPNTPASAPVAPASLSKRSQGAHKAWATRRAKAAATAAAAPKARKAPRTGS